MTACSWGFWSQYGAPTHVLDIVEYGRRGNRPGRHACPAEVHEPFALLVALAGPKQVRSAELHEAGSGALGERCAAERDWLPHR
ncbi:hypothetical protein ABZY44_35460 [Streptomyces sp. NPDC006544]|uniref:hypothetical protein n=1 Tax=Streptomyces sp. NPDC006544 TaxID=3154583 RepID=UPI0033B6A417